jgi:hypothetical protein
MLVSSRFLKMWGSLRNVPLSAPASSTCRGQGVIFVTAGDCGWWKTKTQQIRVDAPCAEYGELSHIRRQVNAR